MLRLMGAKKAGLLDLKFLFPQTPKAKQAETLCLRRGSDE